MLNFLLAAHLRRYKICSQLCLGRLRVPQLALQLGNQLGNQT
jgi:hypothetical protein